MHGGISNHGNCLCYLTKIFKWITVWSVTRNYVQYFWFFFLRFYGFREFSLILFSCVYLGQEYRLQSASSGVYLVFRRLLTLGYEQLHLPAKHPLLILKRFYSNFLGVEWYNRVTIGLKMNTFCGNLNI